MADPTATTARRLPARYVGAAYLETSPKLAGALAAGTVYLVAPDVWPGPWAWLALGPLIAVLVLEPLIRWWSTRLSITAQHVAVASGVIERREQTLAWSDIGTVDSRQSWAFRRWGVHSLTLAQSGDERAKLQLWGVDDPTRTRILSLAGHAVAASATRRAAADEPSGATVEGDLIYRVRSSHLILASLVYGQFAVIGGAAAMAAWEVLGYIDATGALERTISASPVTSAVAIAAVVIVLGFALTVVRYAGFEVRRMPDGRLTIRYGFFSTHARSIAAGATVGVVLQRNLVEIVLGRARLSLLTTDSAAQLGANLVLPSLPRAVVERILRTAFDDQVGHRLLTSSRGAGAFGWGTVLLVASAAAGFGGWTAIAAFDWSPLAAAAGGLLAIVVAWQGSRLLCSRLSVNGDARRVLLTTTHVVQRQSVLSPASVHVVSSTRVLGRRLLVDVHYYAGMARALRAMRFDRADVDALSARVAERRPVTATQRRRAIT